MRKLMRVNAALLFSPAMAVASPLILLIALLAGLAAGWLARRGIRVPLGIATFAAIAVAAGASIRLGRPPVIAVLVDASPSTRGEWFRDATEVRRAAERIISTSSPDATLRYFTFADGGALPMANVIDEQPSTQTSLPAVGADAILLLSDGQFDPLAASTSTPIFPVVEPARSSGDARIIGAEIDSDRAVISVANEGASRTLTWPDGATSVVPRGAIRLSRAANGAVGTVKLNAADRWPENDSLAIAAAATLASERWWIGASPPSDYQAIDPGALPPLEAWIAARSFVINDVPASALSSDAMLTIVQYVRDLGGGLTIVGGEHAFSAGGYVGTPLDALSPLASAPPTPRTQWLLLIDASGSMAAAAQDGRPRLQVAIDAAAAVAQALPPADQVGVASFAKELHAWPTRDDHRVVAPAEVAANGPTNLRAALESVIASRAGRGADALPLRVVALTDGDADLGDIPSLIRSLSDAAVIVDWIALDETDSIRSIAQVARASGGGVTLAGTSGQWRDQAAAAARRASAQPASTRPLPITYRGDLADLGSSVAAQLNTTFGRKDAAMLAEVSDSKAPAAAQWRVGSGRVAGIAYAAPAEVIERVSTLIASPPRDPRFNVRWNSDGRVMVSAVDGEHAMNDLLPNVGELGSTSMPLIQTAPGRYELTLASSTRARIMAVRSAEKTVDLHAVAGAASAEFQHIGLNRNALEQVGARTGGRLIERDRLDGAQINIPRRDVSLAVPLLGLAVISLATALLRSR